MDQDVAVLTPTRERTQPLAVLHGAKLADNIPWPVVNPPPRQTSTPGPWREAQLETRKGTKKQQMTAYKLLILSLTSLLGGQSVWRNLLVGGLFSMGVTSAAPSSSSSAGNQNHTSAAVPNNDESRALAGRSDMGQYNNSNAEPDRVLEGVFVDAAPGTVCDLCGEHDTELTRLPDWARTHTSACPRLTCHACTGAVIRLEKLQRGEL